MRLPRRHALDAGMRPGHRIEVVQAGYDAWRRLMADLEGAQRRIDIQLYMLTDDAVGEAFVAALERARMRGVEVRLTLDGVGSLELSRRLSERLDRAGVELDVYGPIRLEVPWRRWFRRNHRKLLVFDDRVAWVVGMNVSAHYFALDPDQPTWADVGARVEGPLVDDAVALLLRDWFGKRRANAVLARRHASPQPLPALQSGSQPGSPPDALAGSRAALAVHTGRWRDAAVARRYVQAVRSAKRQILLGQSYFLPELALQRALGDAAARGIDVRVLLPALSASDVLVVSLASTHAVGTLLRRGVRVFVLHGRMMHAKFGVVDGAWWTCGSANLDPLSRQRNLEANVVGLDEAVAGELRTTFETLQAGAEELTWAAWQHRPWWQKVLGYLAWLFKPFL